MEKIYDLNYKTNNESNEFLRCLWSRLRKNYGKIAWNLHPIKLAERNYVDIGYIDLGNSHSNESTHVNCIYSQKGCLKSIAFSNSKLIDKKEFEYLLDKSISEAKKYDSFKNAFHFIATLDKSILFKKTEYKNFKIENEKLEFIVHGYDNTDAKTFASSQLRFVKSILSFDTLKFINSSETGIGVIRNLNHREIVLTNTDTGEQSSHLTSDEFKNLDVSEKIGNYIDYYLSKPLNYSEPLNSFEKSILFFSEGLFFEELHNTSFSLDFSSIEYAITSYMSSLELITLNDLESKKCNTCNQETFSISKRIINLAKEANADNEIIKKIISGYYVTRSKFVHTGLLTSMYNYIGNSIPLLSVNSENGVINQHDYYSNRLKFFVKDLILFHEQTNSNFI